MTLSFPSLPFGPQVLQILGWLMLTGGLLQALPEMALMIEMGFSLCLTGGGGAMISVLTHHMVQCWGCPVFLLGLGVIASDNMIRAALDR